MVLVTGNSRVWIFGMILSLVIAGVLYFTIIRPDNNAANQAVKTGLQQSQQVIDQAKKQLGTISSQNGVNTAQAQQAVNKASQLTSCVSAAGTDVSAAEACAAKFGK